jgi:hypothetical protein
MEDTQATLTADAKFLANLKKQCAVTDKVKSMIKKTTFRLLVEQKDKYEHELWCDMETGKCTETWDDKPGKEVLLTVKVMGAETPIKLLVKQITEQQTKVDQITDVKTMPKVTLA